MKIVHIAWLGTCNFGDELMAEAVFDFLKQKYGKISYSVWCDKKPIKKPGRKWIYPFNLKFGFFKRFFERRVLKDCDLLIIGGGSVLHSANSSNWKKAAIDCLKKNNPRAKAIGIGLSIGPFSSSKDEHACINFLQSLDACAFREKFSYEFAKKIRLSYEPVLAFDLGAKFLNLAKKQTKNSNISLVGISLRNPYLTDLQKVFQNYLDLIKKACRRFSKVVLFCFSKDSGELDFCHRLISAAEQKNLEVKYFDGNLSGFIQEIRRCDFFISTKLHGLVLCFLLGIPFISISYQRKSEDFLDYINFPTKYRFKQSDFDPAVLIDEIGNYEFKENGDGLIQRVEENFKLFN